MLNVFSSASRRYLCLIPAPKHIRIVALCQLECFFSFLSVKLHLVMVREPHLPFSECVYSEMLISVEQTEPRCGRCSNTSWCLDFFSKKWPVVWVPGKQIPGTCFHFRMETTSSSCTSLSCNKVALFRLYAEICFETFRLKPDGSVANHMKSELIEADFGR